MTIKTLSAYWPIKGNPKPTNGRHIIEAKKKNLDIFICDEREPPSRSIIKNIYKLKGRAYLKFGKPVKANVFSALCEVWTSKILLLNEISDADYYIWRDCVHNTMYDEIKELNSDKIVIREYKNPPHRPFGGMDTYNYDHLLCAQVIKIPNKIKKEAIDIYTQSLIYIDSNFEIYDEEIVLSYMRDMNPNLFDVIL